jgi:hypothetical protein
VKAKRPLQHDELLLDHARRLIEQGWCRTALAEDRLGRRVQPWSVSACRWSPVGALVCAWYQEGGNGVDVFAAAFLALRLATGGRADEWSAEPWRTPHHVARAFIRARTYLPETREPARRGVATAWLEELGVAS